MCMRRLPLIAATICLLTGATLYLYLTGRFDLLHRKPLWTVEVNGAVVDGEVLAGRASALATRRDKGREHSYLLLYAGDVDQKGDVGQVIDCQNWVAPRLPILIATSDYPNCKLRHEQNADSWRMSLTIKDASEQFVTADRDVISIRQR
jgi:hypothetical protein